MRKGRKPITLSAGILILLFTLMPLGGCQQQKGEFQRQLSAADSLMRTDADSAFRMLCGMDSLATCMPKSLRMEHLLLRCNAQNKADSLFSSDSLGLLLTRYFDQEGTPNQRMLAHYVLGCAYRDMGDSPSALQCFSDAVAAADTAAVDCDLYQLSIIYGQAGGIYSSQCLSEEALKAFGMAELYATRIGDSLRIYNIWSNKSNSYFYQGNFKEGVEMKERAADGQERMGYVRYAAQTRGLCVEWLSHTHQWDKAKRYLEDYVKHSGYFQPDGTATPGHEACYDIVIVYYTEKGEMDSARHYMQKWMPHVKAIGDKHAFALRKRDYYYQVGPKDSLISALIDCHHLFDLLHTERTVHNYQQIHAKNDYTRHDQKALQYQLESQQTRSRLQAWIIITLGILLLVIVGALLFGRRIKEKLFQYKLAHEQDSEQIKQQQEALHSYETEKQDLQQQIDQYSTIIDQLNEDISEKTQELALTYEQLAQENQQKVNIDELQEELSHHQATIDELQQKLSHHLSTIDKLQQEVAAHQQVDNQLERARKQKQLRDEPAIKHLMDLAAKHKMATYEDLSAAISTVEKYYPNIASLRLISSVTEMEYCVSALIKIGMKLHDIMLLLGKDNSYLTTLRRRLYEKISNQDGGAKDCDRYIQQL